MQGLTNFERREYCYEEGCARGADGFRIGNLWSSQLTPGAVKQLPGVSRFYQQIVGFPSFARLSFEDRLACTPNETHRVPSGPRSKVSNSLSLY